MGFRFHRRISIIPGLRVNLSKSGASLSIGHRGAWYTIGPHGRRVTLGLPGTGLSWTETVSRAAPVHGGQPATPPGGFYLREPIPPAPPVHGGHRAAFALAVAAIGLFILLAGRA
ncbi:MAG: DUF4236 domain-containing protein [Roseiarcus sp.]